ncbi:hypothetical protein [Fluviicola sp.]|uniref:hypothetical protein n=1 Tax=Fluviicola sp. TaxID=1917219 RepID=UPI003D266720
MSNRPFFTLLSFLFFTYSLFSQTIRLEEIMKGEEFVGFSPQDIQWSIDNESVTFDWNPTGELGRSLYAYKLKQKQIQKVGFLENRPISSPTLRNHSQIFNNHYFNQDGELVRYNQKTKEHVVIYSRNEPIGEIFRVKNPSFIYFTIQSNVFCYDETVGSIVQVTNFVQGNQVVEKTDTSFLHEQQRELFSFIKLQDEKKKWNEKQPQRKTPVGIYYSKNEYVSKYSISSDGRYISFVLTMDSDEPTTNYESYITSDGFTHHRQARPKVNDKEPSTRMGIFDNLEDTVYFVDYSSLKDIRKMPLSLRIWDKRFLF